jgi:hypothetical protein
MYSNIILVRGGYADTVTEDLLSELHGVALVLGLDGELDVAVLLVGDEEVGVVVVALDAQTPLAHHVLLRYRLAQHLQVVLVPQRVHLGH